MRIFPILFNLLRGINKTKEYDMSKSSEEKAANKKAKADKKAQKDNANININIETTTVMTENKLVDVIADGLKNEVGRDGMSLDARVNKFEDGKGRIVLEINCANETIAENIAVMISTYVHSALNQQEGVKVTIK